MSDFTQRWTELRALTRRQFEDYVLHQVQRYRCDPGLASGFVDETWRAEMRAELHRMITDREVHGHASNVRDHRAFFRKIAARHGLAVGANQRITREAPHRALVFEAVFFMVLLRAMPDPVVADSEYLGWATLVCRYGVSKVHHGMHLVRLLVAGIVETHEYVHTYQQRRAVFEQARKDAVFLPAFLPIVPPPVDLPHLALFPPPPPLPSSLPLFPLPPSSASSSSSASSASSSASVLAPQTTSPPTMRSLLDRMDAELTAAELLFRAGDAESARVHAALFHVSELVVEAHRAQHALLMWRGSGSGNGSGGGSGCVARMQELAGALQRHAALILRIASASLPSTVAAAGGKEEGEREAKRARADSEDAWIDDISEIFAGGDAGDVGDAGAFF